MIERIQHGPEGRKLRGRTHRKLVHICLPDDDRIFTAQFPDDGGIVQAGELLKHSRTAGNLLSFHREDILDGDDHPCKRPGLSLSKLPVNADRLFDCLLAQGESAADAETRTKRAAELVPTLLPKEGES